MRHLTVTFSLHLSRLQAEVLRDVGGVVLANACGPCIGQWDRYVTLSPAEPVHQMVRMKAGACNTGARMRKF